MKKHIQNKGWDLWNVITKFNNNKTLIYKKINLLFFISNLASGEIYMIGEWFRVLRDNKNKLIGW